MGFGNSQEISGNIYKFLRRLWNCSSFFLIPMCNFYLFDYCATYNCGCCHEQFWAIPLKLWQHVTMLDQGCNQTQIQLSSHHHHHHHHHHPSWLPPHIMSTHHGLNNIYTCTSTTTSCAQGSATTLTWPWHHILHDPPLPLPLHITYDCHHPQMLPTTHTHSGTHTHWLWWKQHASATSPAVPPEQAPAVLMVHGENNVACQPLQMCDIVQMARTHAIIAIHSTVLFWPSVHRVWCMTYGVHWTRCS